MFKNNNNHNSGCFSTEDLMSYLYGEISSSERGRLDLHLAECRTCTEDFASVSESRFSVYEWQRNDFATLQTPVIMGPWDNPPVRQTHSLAEPASVSWIERIIASVGPYRSWAFAAGAFGVLAVGVWFGLLTLTGHDQTQQAGISGDKPAVAAVPNENAPPPIAEANKREPQGNEVHNVPVMAGDRRSASPLGRVAMAENRQTHRHQQNPVDLKGKKSEMASVKKAPNLSGIEEDEDKSVRLADLFAEVGSGYEDN